MTRQELFEYVTKNWYLKDGIVYSHYTGRPISFEVNHNGHLRHHVNSGLLKGCIRIHQAVYMLHYNKPIGEGMQIHHIDGNPLNNDPSNLIELTPKQHRRIHVYQSNDQMRGIRLYRGVWQFRWCDDNGRRCSKTFHGINEAMKFRAEIEEPYRAELRALGLDC
ncbi:TPA: HNH endonuclease signature motif containing protein [Escherichia coli]